MVRIQKIVIVFSLALTWVLIGNLTDMHEFGL